jgi:hypothetical protein
VFFLIKRIDSREQKIKHGFALMLTVIRQGERTQDRGGRHLGRVVHWKRPVGDCRGKGVRGQAAKVRRWTEVGLQVRNEPTKHLVNVGGEGSGKRGDAPHDRRSVSGSAINEPSSWGLYRWPTARFTGVLWDISCERTLPCVTDRQ